MPSIELYLDIPDLPLLEAFLNKEEEIAFVLRSGDGTFTCVGATTLQPNASYTLWHVSSGEIPADCRDERGRIIVDPSRGVHPGAIRLRLEACPGKYQQLVQRQHATGYELKLFEDSTAIGRSGFAWLGNKFKPVGTPAHPSTDQWWRRLRNWVAKHGRKVTWSGPLDSPESELRVWAFPFAYAAFSNGRPRSVNPVLWEKG